MIEIEQNTETEREREKWARVRLTNVISHAFCYLWFCELPFYSEAESERKDENSGKS